MYIINSNTDPKELMLYIEKDVGDIMPILKNIPMSDEIKFAKDASDVIRKCLWDSHITNIKNRISEWYKCALIRGINLSEYDVLSAKRFLIAFSWMLGSPTYTDDVEKLVAWDVTPRKELYVKNTTFSQRDWEAELHTDTQYYPLPEKYILLACHHKAWNGWNSTLIDGRSLFEDIKVQNPELFSRLINEKLPFRVPSSFTRSGTDDNVELYFAPIFSKDLLIRYRKETIEKWLVFMPKVEQEKYNKLIEDFEFFLRQKERILEFWLEDNDILICNNHEYLHWRTHFTDPERLLFRIRFN